MPLDATQALVSERQKELADLNLQLKSVQQALPQKTGELEKAENELRIVEAQKELAVQGAREAMGRRGDCAEAADDLEMRGRWLTGVESTLKGFLEVGAKA